MKKYKRTVCSYIYDPEKGDPNLGIETGFLLKILLMIGLVQSAIAKSQDS